jgi:hypothetical protein
MNIKIGDKLRYRDDPTHVVEVVDFGRADDGVREMQLKVIGHRWPERIGFTSWWAVGNINWEAVPEVRSKPILTIKTQSGTIEIG